ncbi:hypothetical protein C0991_005960 [Blastosporella zonata]|nr:hypothetical protein C0991_005960 [Blastosporella zonata]
MSADDDYLSDKFLIPDASTTVPTKTYAQLRKEAERKAHLKNEQNKTKSRRQRELEAREEGLSKSLFERAKEEEDAGTSSGNKALSMMMKMGFKPGQSLGKLEDPPVKPPAASEGNEHQTEAGPSYLKSTTPVSGHIVKPLPLNEWTGKKGIGLGKRARSPSTSAERVAKMAKMAKETEEVSHQDYRNRARREYEEKRAEGRLEGLMDALALRGATGLPHEYHGEPIQVRLRKQMQADALRPLEETPLTPKGTTLAESFPPEVIEEAIPFLRLQAQDRLSLVLTYLRDVYDYCFWCGVQYDDDETMEKQCPGPDEESHD